MLRFGMLAKANLMKRHTGCLIASSMSNYNIIDASFFVKSMTIDLKFYLVQKMLYPMGW